MLLLVPAAMLVFLAMVALVIDAATMFLAERQLADLAAATAQDAVRALDVPEYYASGAIRVDRDAAARRMRDLRVDFERHAVVDDVACVLDTRPARAVASCRGRAHPILAQIWGGSNGVEIAATESARAALG